jgi:hypothetical protein
MLLFKDLPEEYFVILTINNLQKEIVGHKNKLTVTNEEGSTNYQFILEIRSKPPFGKKNKEVIARVSFKISLDLYSNVLQLK